MPASVFEYAIIRVVPNIERGECLNSGVVVFARQHRFLEARIQLNEARLRSLAADIDIEPLRTQLEHIPIICAGGKLAGPIGALPAPERFRWIVAPRSTIIQTSPVHCGLCEHPGDALEKLFERLVR
ncbi:MAG: DUF3037 domain-containing protein [Roseiflexaceae bacterium]|nr:DUF3037 domain-containing protein [Roseiflexaceae bacterium]